MTSFVAWVGVDARGPASVYFASDSRISWGTQAKWDHGRKVFAAGSTPDILGYVGAVLFPSLVLGQITAQLNAGVLRKQGDEASAVWQRICGLVQSSFASYPVERERPFEIMYAARDGELLGAFAFRVWSLGWNGSAWSEDDLGIPNSSARLRVLGSGRRSIDTWSSRWDSSRQGGTSRAVFSAFCDSLSCGGDQFSGGPPQLVGLYRRGAAISFGTYFGGTATFAGQICNGQESNVEWRNHLFERVDHEGRLVAGGKSHYSPKGLGRTRPV